MRIPVKILALSAASAAAIAGSAAGVPAQARPAIVEPPRTSCQASYFMDRLADDYIGLCKKGSIRREFPAQYLHWYLGQIRSHKSATARKAWKLLNDSRFNKH